MSPIAIFVYNRPDYLQVTLQSLSKNAGIGQSILYVFADGPKPDASAKDLDKIAEVQQLVKAIDFCQEVILYESHTNKGLARSVMAGVTEVLKNHERVIVLEDDLELSPYFLKYMNEGLQRFEHENKVMTISGYNYPIDTEGLNEKVFLNRRVNSWGWATWVRAWQYFEPDAKVLHHQLMAQGTQARFDMDNTYPFTKMLANVAQKQIDSWAIRWYASVFLQGGLSLYPTHSLVKHIGDVGTHFKVNNHDLIGNTLHTRAIDIPQQLKIEENPEIQSRMVQHLCKHDRRRFSWQSIQYYAQRLWGEVAGMIPQ